MICEKCGEEIVDKSYTRSYLRGRWIYLHSECESFLMDARKGNRGELYLYLLINGLAHTEIRFSDEDLDPAEFARGEGNCLKFKLVDTDTTVGFSEALKSGDIIRRLEKTYHPVNIQLRRFWKKGNLLGETYPEKHEFVLSSDGNISKRDKAWKEITIKEYYGE